MARCLAKCCAKQLPAVTIRSLGAIANFFSYRPERLNGLIAETDFDQLAVLGCPLYGFINFYPIPFHTQALGVAFARRPPPNVGCYFICGIVFLHTALMSDTQHLVKRVEARAEARGCRTFRLMACVCGLKRRASNNQLACCCFAIIKARFHLLNSEI